MLDERQQAAVWGVRRGELGAFFHGYGYSWTRRERVG
jgi:hypothetical protein